MGTNQKRRQEDSSSIKGLEDKTKALAGGFVLNQGAWGQIKSGGRRIRPQSRGLRTKQKRRQEDSSSTRGLENKS
ncbi:hypothetical protein NP83_00520 [Neobacillus niacini]|nr:hypothetical protein NP83_00520 [Neobacillus niacini]